jgi:ATP-dependent DNA helicase DinG
LAKNRLIPDSKGKIPDENARTDSTFETIGETGDPGSETRWRIPLSRRDEPQWAGIHDQIEEMINLIAAGIAPLRKVCSRLRELVEEGHDDLEHVWIDLSAIFNRLDASAGFLKRVLEGEELEEVFWAEVRRRRGRLQVSLHMTPLNAAPILQQTLFNQIPSIVLTSATLTVADRFDFLDKRLGIGVMEDRPVVHRIYPSPFDLSIQMRLALLDNIPDPGKPGFVETFSAAVLDSILSAGGGGLILFTSYRTLSRVYELCETPLVEAGINIMRQGEMPRSVLLDRFRVDPDSVLFATDSFWEGVDVVGNALRVVILARLPFPVPTDPVNEARNEVLLAQGRDPFMEDSVPRAVIRMRQGLGRLIRHREDNGYAVICDGRIVRRAYGRIFLQSLGDITAHRVSMEELKADIGEFLKR